MYVQTKKELLDYIECCTRNFQADQMHVFSANYISREKNISRNLVSQYLNEFVKEGIMIKVNSRPVYFIHRKALERLYDVNLNKVVFYSVNELLELLMQSEYCQKDFGKAIGSRLSLNYCVEQCKAAVKYPPSGLPILIVGSTGTGKSYFARLTFEYAVNSGLIDKKNQFYVINCSEYKNNPEKLGKILFGEIGQEGDETTGLLELANESVLFFDEVHNLTPDCQEKLFVYMDTGKFQKEGEKNRWYISSTRLIFATTENPEGALLNTLLRRIPFVMHLPDLRARSLDEKEELLLYFLKKEAKRIGREIYFSHQMLNLLLNYSYKGNVGEMENIIRTSCAAAYLNSRDKEILQMKSYHLPGTLLMEMKTTLEKEEELESMICLSEYQQDASMNRMTALFDGLLDIFLQYSKEEISFEEFAESGMSLIHNYYDYIVFERYYTDVKIRAIHNVLIAVFEEISDKYSVVIPANCSFVLSRSIFTISQFYSSLELWEKERLEELKNCLTVLKNRLPKEGIVTTEVSKAVKKNLDLQMNRISEIFLTLNIWFYNKGVELNDTLGIIISHGYSTASSIADTANKVLHANVFDAIDMPLDIQMPEIALKLKKYVLSHPGYKSILLLVDMGSLEELGTKMEEIPNIKIGIINHISTELALEVGSRILQNQPMEEYLEDVCDKNRSSCKLISTQKKVPAVLFTSEMGMEAAERIKELFRHSLLEKKNIELMLYSYHDLLKKSEVSRIFDRYQIICIIGTLNPKMENIPFISLDMLVTNKGTDCLEQIFSLFLTEEEIIFLRDKILENFSLQNVVENLTILNADTLLDYVIHAVKRMQNLLGRNFTNKTSVGLYVHICCLVERLVTKAEIETRPDTEAFIQGEKDFVRCVNNAFREIQKHYRIQLPDSEIMFLYEYVKYDDQEEEF